MKPNWGKCQTDHKFSAGMVEMEMEMEMEMDKNQWRLANGTIDPLPHEMGEG